MTNYITLSDPTPNRGTVKYYGPSRDDAIDARPDDTALVLPAHRDNAEAPELGYRVYHNNKFAWRSLGHSEISEDRVRALRAEAGATGDLKMVDVCDEALAGDDDAMGKVRAALADAEAQAAD